MSIVFPITFDISKSIHSLDIEIPEDTSVLDSLSTETISNYLSKRCKFYCNTCNSPMTSVATYYGPQFKGFCKKCNTHTSYREIK